MLKTFQRVAPTKAATSHPPVTSAPSAAVNSQAILRSLTNSQKNLESQYSKLPAPTQVKCIWVAAALGILGPMTISSRAVAQTHTNTPNTASPPSPTTEATHLPQVSAESIRALSISGNEVLIDAENTHWISRSGQQRVLTRSTRPLAIASQTLSDGLVQLAVLDDRGGLATQIAEANATHTNNQGWSINRVPDPFFSQGTFAAFTVGPDGTAYVALRSRGLFVYRERQWLSVSYPEGVSIRAVAASREGLWLVGDHGTLLEYRQGTRQTTQIPLATVSNPSGDPSVWTSIWSDGNTRNTGTNQSRLWVGTDDGRLLSVDPAHRAVREWLIPGRGSVRSVSGTVLPTQQEALVVIAGETTWIHTNDQFTELTDAQNANAAVFDSQTQTVYAANARGVRAISTPFANVTNSAVVNVSASHEQLPELPETPAEIAATRDSLGWWPRLRLGLGMSVYAQREGVLVPQVGFDTDVALGLTPTLYRGGRRIYFPVELMYSYHGGERVEGHLASLGVGVGVGNSLVGAAYIPRFLLGTSGNNASFGAWGIRHGVSIEFFRGSFGLEAAHEWRTFDGQSQHQAHIALTVDFVPLIGHLIVPSLLPRAIQDANTTIRPTRKPNRQ